MKKSLTYPRDVSRGAARASCSNLGNSCFIDVNLFKRYLSEVSRIFVRNLSAAEMKKKCLKMYSTEFNSWETEN